MKDLIKRLEKATEGSRELDAEIWAALHGRKFVRVDNRPAHPMDAGSYVWIDDLGNRITCWSNSAYTRSLDAAMTLVPEGKNWDVSGGHSTHVWATVWIDGGTTPEHLYQVPGATPALALCLAVLRARQEG